jgi:hypothetical protein
MAEYVYNQQDKAGNMLKHANLKGLWVQQPNGVHALFPQVEGEEIYDISNVNNVVFNAMTREKPVEFMPLATGTIAAKTRFLELYRMRTASKRVCTANREGEVHDMSKTIQKPRASATKATPVLPISARSSTDEEIGAMSTAYEAFRQLDKGAQRRALNWLCSKLSFEQ